MKILFLFLMGGLLSLGAQAHETAHGSRRPTNTVALSPTALTAINRDYVQNVRPIFAQKCFDCHTGQTRYPRYYSLPGVKQLIDRDIREGRKHLDVSDDFPFKSHATPQEDLEEIAEVVKENTMPPWRYWVLHRDT